MKFNGLDKHLYAFFFAEVVLDNPSINGSIDIYLCPSFKNSLSVPVNPPTSRISPFNLKCS